MSSIQVPITAQKRTLVIVPTNVPDVKNPADISARAIARFKAASEFVATERLLRGRANVLLAIVGGWALHDRLPLSVHHAYAAVEMHEILKLEDLDFLFSCGVNTSSDLIGTLSRISEPLEIDDAVLISSRGHAKRMAAESGLDRTFRKITYIESGEARDTTEDELWEDRVRDIPPHQFSMGGRMGDTIKFGTAASFKYSEQMRSWAEQEPESWEGYIAAIWRFVRKLEKSNVVLRSETPGCWRLLINC